jgi:hypothetical protein
MTAWIQIVNILNQNSKTIKMKHYLFILFYLFCNVFIYAFHGSFWVYLFCFLLFSALVIWGSFDIELGYFVNSITHKRTKIREVALTFDDGPTEFTPKFLDLLKENEVKATFFCIGKQIEKYPETFQRIIAEGHTLEIIHFHIPTIPVFYRLQK